MARLPRLNLPNIPQHVIQRGNNRTVCFFAEPDYQFEFSLVFVILNKKLNNYWNYRNAQYLEFYFNYLIFLLFLFLIKTDRLNWNNSR